MDHISDELAILQTLYRFTHAQDRLDLATMATLLIPDQTIKFDLSKHFPEAGVLQGNAMEICNILYEASAGWTATQHPVYNPLITFGSQNSSKATVQAMVQAYHCLEKDGQVDNLTVRATWYVEMEKVDDTKWLITGMAMERDVPIANAVLFEQMRAQMDQGHKRKPTSNVAV